MAKRSDDLSAPLQSIRATSRITGLSSNFIRTGCKNGTIPHIRVGEEYRIHIPLFLKQLAGESLENMRKDVDT
jgi:hypothetical protein